MGSRRRGVIRSLFCAAGRAERQIRLENGPTCPAMDVTGHQCLNFFRGRRRGIGAIALDKPNGIQTVTLQFLDSIFVNDGFLER